MLPALGGAIRAMSEPMVSHDAVAFYLLSEEVSRSLKVVQSGQGADEVFAGYSWYPPLSRRRGIGRRRLPRGVLRPAAAPSSPSCCTPEYLLEDDPSWSFVDDHFAEPGADGAGRPRRSGSTPRSCSSTTRSSGSTT